MAARHRLRCRSVSERRCWPSSRSGPGPASLGPSAPVDAGFTPPRSRHEWQGMQWNRGRALAVGGLAAGAAAALVAVLAALSAPASGVRAAQATITSHATAFGRGRVAVQVLPGGTVCYRVTER